MFTCAFCGSPIEIEDKVFFKDECPACRRELHCCVQCVYYEPGRHNDCTEVRAERVVLKDRVNRCDWFRFGPRGRVGDGAASEAKSRLEALFKKG